MDECVLKCKHDIIAKKRDEQTKAQIRDIQIRHDLFLQLDKKKREKEKEKTEFEKQQQMLQNTVTTDITADVRPQSIRPTRVLIHAVEEGGGKKQTHRRRKKSDKLKSPRRKRLRSKRTTIKYIYHK